MNTWYIFCVLHGIAHTELIELTKHTI
jgi:hypothetical protein